MEGLPYDIQLEILNQRCILNIRERLRTIGFEPDEFFHQLRQSKGILAGGFVLSCMLSEPVANQDIDVYLPFTGNPGYHLGFEPMENYIFRTLPQSAATGGLYSDLPHIHYVREYWKHELPSLVQTITIAGIEPKAFVQQEFDLSFCRLVYDGDTISYYPWKRSARPVRDYSTIFNHVGVLVNIPLCFDTYTDSNVALRTVSDQHAELYNVYWNSPLWKEPLDDGVRIVRHLASLKRIIKYQKRGFRVLGFSRPSRWHVFGGDVMAHVLLFLENGKDVCNMKLVCRLWRNAVTQINPLPLQLKFVKGSVAKQREISEQKFCKMLTNNLWFNAGFNLHLFQRLATTPTPFHALAPFSGWQYLVWPNGTLEMRYRLPFFPREPEDISFLLPLFRLFSFRFRFFTWKYVKTRKNLVLLCIVLGAGNCPNEDFDLTPYLKKARDVELPLKIEGKRRKIDMSQVQYPGLEQLLVRAILGE